MNSNQLTYNFTIKNKGSVSDPNVVVRIFPPAGTAVYSLNFQQGGWDPSTNTWSTGEIKAYHTAPAIVTLTKTGSDPITEPLRIMVNGQYADVNPADNIDEAPVVFAGDASCSTTPKYIMDTKSCPPPSAQALPSIAGLISLNVNYNDKLCTSGTTEWRIVPVSETNITILWWDMKKGIGAGKHINPILPWSFQYGIYCTGACLNCPTGNEYGPFSVVTVTGAAAITCPEITGCVSEIFSFLKIVDLHETECPEVNPVNPVDPPAEPKLNDIVMNSYDFCDIYYRYNGVSWDIVLKRQIDYNVQGSFEVVKVVLDLNNDTTINCPDTPLLSQMIRVSVDNVQIDHASQALPTFESYTITGNNITLSIPFTGVGRVEYLKLV